MFRKAWLFFANLSMQKKLVIVFVFLISLPVTYFSYTSYRSSFRLVESSTTEAAHLMTDNAMDKVDRYIADLKRYTSLPLYNKEVQKYLDQQGTDWDKSTAIDIFLMYLNNTKDEILSAYLVDRYDMIFYYRKSGINMLYPETQLNEWKALARKSGSSPALAGTHAIRVNETESRQVFTVVRPIRSVSSLHDIGLIAIDVDAKLFEGIIEPLNAVTHGDALIVDEYGKVVYNADPAKLGEDLSGSPLLAPAAGARGSYQLTIDGRPYICVYTSSAQTGWKTLVYIPLTELLAPMKQNRDKLMITTLSVIFFALLVAIVISYALTKPLKRTVQLMKQVQRGKLDVRVNVKYNDEIGLLGSQFNRMIARVKDLLHEVAETEKSKQKADMLALQNQINPHFIYNTLESIRMLAELNDDDRVAELTYLLGLLLRYSITRNADEHVTVGQEIDHVRNYLLLLQLRFPDKFNFRVEIPEHFYPLPIVKLVFQPIVENAVFHGLEKREGSGTITIRAWNELGDAIFTVQDDGVGMTEERLDSLNHSLTDGKTNKFGIGLRNVRERIRLHYGADSRLTVSSRPGEGTTVTVRIAGLFCNGAGGVG
ncbi:sensor histidine kinase [Paenibacillus macerans]|uniref:cache domain-containing sensor histidine kinase n=1 Tax=Paenibacillus macerans TaxID=44252 RepID=UPI00203D1E35|nr:sensor histidine kinase [Paenibacillus macerans]MCM3701714.1 sensor histidine kinase [Paenibacillus macerans]